MRPSMRPTVGLVVLILAGACTTPQPARDVSGAAAEGAAGNAWVVSAGPGLLRPVANNAVAAALVQGRPHVFSFLGLESARDFSAITTRAFVLDIGSAQWAPLPDVPGEVGRLAATAQAIGSRVFLIGGYSVAADGKEATSPATDIYLADERRYLRGADTPVPVDDTVSGVWRNRLIYLVSGWSTDRTVTTVQAYDPKADQWLTATPIPGTPVFGHAGGLIGDTIVYCGGARMSGGGSPKYVPNAECFRGDIDAADPARIVWHAIPAHPGAPRYRAAAAAIRTPTHAGILFAGGTVNPYNYNGIGYDGRPAAPESSSWIYLPDRNAWVAGPTLQTPTMDHRGLVHAAGAWWIVGGYRSGQEVSAHVTRLAAREPGRD